MEEETTTEEQQSINWRADVSEASSTLKILDGDTKKVVILDEGTKRESADYGKSIVFKVEFEKEEMNFYVKANNYSLLKQFKELGKLTGKVVEISRTGSKKSDTRYTIQEIESIGDKMQKAGETIAKVLS